MKENVTLNIRRYKPRIKAGPRFETYTLTIDTRMSILDTLDKIRNEQDPTLMYRHSCHHSSCGTCGMLINGQERLACITSISKLKKRPITLEPLPDFPLIGDLVVDMTSFYKDMDENWDFLRTAEDLGNNSLPEGITRFEWFENCIECGCCVSACPASGPDKPFMGPAVLAAVNAELKKSKKKEKGLLELAGSEQGVLLCERALECSRVCPTEVYPARHIMELRRRIHGQ
jgi:succinate dehydrogenase / fumarate reductase iron-sulfur subunit